MQRKQHERSTTLTSSVAWPLSPCPASRHSTFLTFLIEINALAFVLIKFYLESSAFHLPSTRKHHESSLKQDVIPRSPIPGTF